MLELRFCVFVLIELLNNHGSIGIDQQITYHSMTSDILTSNSYSLATTHWNDASDISACAVKSYSSCAGSLGFVYNTNSKICIPLLQLGLAGGTTLGSANPLQWKLFVIDDLCPTGFDAYNTSAEGHYICLTVLTTSYTYETATTQCNHLGGFLASIRTVGELEVIRTLADSKDVWVGMDDLVREGEHRWQEDGRLLTSQEQQDVFKPGEPNNYFGVEDCVYYRASHRALSDHHFWSTKRSFCESAPVSGSC